MKQEKREKSITALCAPVLLLVLAAGILTVLLGSASAYRRQNSRGQVSGDRRTAALYFTGKLRQTDGPVTLVPFGQGTALEISQEVSGSAYVTRIYCFDGWLRELFAPTTGEFAPEDGEKVLPMEALEFSLEGNLLHIRFADLQGTGQVLKLTLPTGEGAQP